MVQLSVHNNSMEHQLVKLLVKYLNLKDVSITPTTNKDEESFLRLDNESEPLKHFPLMLDRLLRSSPQGLLLLPTDPDLKATMDSFVDFAHKHGFNMLDVETLRMLDTYLLNETFFGGATISLADVVLFVSVNQWTYRSKSKEHNEVPNLMRWFDHMQHLPEFTSCFEDFQMVKLFEEKLVLSEPKMGKQQVIHNLSEKVDKKKEKKEKPKVEKPPVETRPYDDVTRLNVVVGHVLSIRKHQDADKLYCLKIDVGTEVRNICSGLVDFLKPEQILDKKVCVLANLPKKNLRGEESNGMVLCVSNVDKTAVELLEPPKDTPVGERVHWEGLSGEADEQLSNKKGKDTFSMVQKDFNCKDNVGYYKDLKFMTSKGACVCPKISTGTIS